MTRPRTRKHAIRKRDPTQNSLKSGQVASPVAGSSGEVQLRGWGVVRLGRQCAIISATIDFSVCDLLDFLRMISVLL